MKHDLCKSVRALQKWVVVLSILAGAGVLALCFTDAVPRGWELHGLVGVVLEWEDSTEYHKRHIHCSVGDAQNTTVKIMQMHCGGSMANYLMTRRFDANAELQNKRF